ncbi:MAG: hypothetical protein A2Z15_04305 [Chloroflexi bacterium RBG_16_50_11]|nr:MAG: hypothetical protein A2Z15_04305 [Chloroflexi bacterium RBG_16_50_11]
MKAFKAWVRDYNFARCIYRVVCLLNWELKGRPIPSPELAKHRTVREYARKFSLKTMVETGTYYGDTVNATKNLFHSIATVEINEAFYRKAKRRFARFGHIKVLCGDSSQLMPQILGGVSKPCLFFLDAHYPSGTTIKALETPLMKELTDILDHPVKDHVILIDDARLCVGKGDWPDVSDLRGLVLKHRPDWVFENKHDIIRIHRRFASGGKGGKWAV